MIVVVPGSCPWVMLPDGKLIVSFGCWLVSFSPNTGFVVSLVCAATGLVTLERKRHNVGGVWGWDCQPVWPIGRCGAFRYPRERWQLGLVLWHSFKKRMYSMYDIFVYDFSGCSFVFYSEFAFNLDFDLCVWLFTGYVYISHLLFVILKNYISFPADIWN